MRSHLTKTLKAALPPRAAAGPLGLCLMLVGALLIGDAGGARAAKSSSLAFLTAEDIDPSGLLPPPPADGSPLAVAEMAELHRIEAGRTPAAFDAAKADDATESGAAFAPVFGSGFDLKALPATARLLADVRNEEKIAASAAKTYFHRNRPWIVDPALKACATADPPQSSYPSGHATMGYAMAVVLARAAPDKAQALMARAAQYAENRLVCEMHFRSDIVAGQTLGSAVAVDLLHNAKFQAEVDAAREELKAARLAGG